MEGLHEDAGGRRQAGVVEQGLCIVGGACGRFLEQHMFAFVEGLPSSLEMKTSREGNVHHVDFGVLKDCCKCVNS